MATDYYQALGVSRTASQDEIQQAYRTLARRFHPDINHDPGAEDRFKEVSEAYEVLSDPAQRQRYDRFGESFRHVDEAAYERSRARAGSRTGARSGAGGEPGGGSYVYSGGGVDVEDLFGSLFGGGGGGLAGADQEVVLDLSVEEAYNGGRRWLRLDGRARGSYEVSIPRGVIDGQRIRLAGEGGQGYGDGPPGDLYLVVRIRPHPRYRLQGRDIHLDLPVTPWEAALGATIAVSTPGGEVKVRMPAGSSSGRKLRLREEGMPNPGGRSGDLYAEVKVMVPATLSPRERELFEQLATVSDFDPREGS